MLSVLIPVFNEQQILEQSLRKIHDYLVTLNIEYEIIVVSNGSTDNTDKIGQSLESQLSWLRFYSLSEKSVGAAFALAASEARGNHLVSLDIDLSFDLKFIEYAQDLLRYSDMVVGSKSMGKQSRAIIRIIASQIYILITQVLFGLTISDYSIGCKAYRKESISDILPFIDNWTGYVLEICVYLHRKRMKIIQIGIDCDDRRKSHFSLLHEGFYRYYHLVKTWYRIKTNDSWF